jgi:hypothetical protein
MARPTIMQRRQFIRDGALLAAGVLLPLPAAAQWAEIHELSGEVRLDGRRIARNAAIQAGQTLATGADGRIWFTLAGDAYFLRTGSELRLRGFPGRDKLIEVLRLVTGALGATFARGPRRSVVAGTVTVGIRGTGVYVETRAEETYACTCFGTTEVNGLTVSATNHAARLLRRGDPRLQEAPLERHTNEEMGRLESLAGRPYPFRP